MKKQFYHQLVSFEELEGELDTLSTSSEEKKHLKSLAEENVHFAIIDLVLSELSSEDKKTFLKHLHTEDQEKAWELLKEKSSGIEQKIRQVAARLMEELRKDIQEVRGK